MEKAMFGKARCDFSKLLPFGFAESAAGYTYSAQIMEGEFCAQIHISPDGEVTGRLYDTAFHEEYTGFRIRGGGAYSNTVRAEYEALLQSIREQCFTPLYYETETANALVDYIREHYGDHPSFEFKRNPDISAIRSHKTGEWYAFLLKLDGRETIYLKLPEERVAQLIQKDGILKSTFLSEKRWIVIPLEYKLTLEEIIPYLQEAHDAENKQSHWLIPANPEYYDIIGAFEKSDTSLWKQKGKIYVGDTIYLYLAAPISAILFRCEVIENNIPHSFTGSEGKTEKVFRMKLIKKYRQDELPISLLREHGITWIRGPRRLPDSLVKEIQRRETDGN